VVSAAGCYCLSARGYHCGGRRYLLSHFAVRNISSNYWREGGERWTSQLLNPPEPCDSEL